MRIPPKYFPLAGLTAILIGVFLLLFPSFWRGEISWPGTKEPIIVDSALLKATEPANSPTRIIIPSVKIDLPIVEAKVVQGYWETSATSASHGLGSASPGDRGNMVLFAHARKGLFLPLRNIKMGEVVEVFNNKEQKYRYQVFEIKEVPPNQVEVISQTPDERLTLYTCSGFLDSKRLVVVAKSIND